MIVCMRYIDKLVSVWYACLQGWQGKSKYTKWSLPNLANIKPHWSAEKEMTDKSRVKCPDKHRHCLRSGLQMLLLSSIGLLLTHAINVPNPLTWPAEDSTEILWCFNRMVAFILPKSGRAIWGITEAGTKRTMSGISVLHSIKWVVTYPWNLT